MTHLLVSLLEDLDMRTHIVPLAVAFLVCGPSTTHPQNSASEITVTILYDNTVFTKGTRAEWGFSCFIQSAGDTILFDGGTVDTILLRNAHELGVDLSTTKRMFISHDHLDHAGGLRGALEAAPGVPVYVGAHFSPSVVDSIALNRGRPVRVTEPIEISRGFFSAGELPSSRGTYEQALVLETDSGLVIVVGCSHPGIVEILQRVKRDFKKDIFAVFGGFHLLNLTQPQVGAVIQGLRNLGVQKCGPTHCTGEGPIQWISQAYGSDFLRMGVGQVLRFSAPKVSGSVQTEDDKPE